MSEQAIERELAYVYKDDLARLRRIEGAARRLMALSPNYRATVPVTHNGNYPKDSAEAVVEDLTQALGAPVEDGA